MASVKERKHGMPGRAASGSALPGSARKSAIILKRVKVLMKCGKKIT